jgi:hypothetical protein
MRQNNKMAYPCIFGSTRNFEPFMNDGDKLVVVYPFYFINQGNYIFREPSFMIYEKGDIHHDYHTNILVFHRDMSYEDIVEEVYYLFKSYFKLLAPHFVNPPISRVQNYKGAIHFRDNVAVDGLPVNFHTYPITEIYTLFRTFHPREHNIMIPFYSLRLAYNSIRNIPGDNREEILIQYAKSFYTSEYNPTNPIHVERNRYLMYYASYTLLFNSL